jgi:hypothetical protein
MLSMVFGYYREVTGEHDLEMGEGSTQSSSSYLYI